LRTRRRSTRIVPLALVAVTVFSCNGLLDNDRPHLVPGLGEGGDGEEPSSGGSRSSGGTTGMGGAEASVGGTGGFAGAPDAGAPGNGGNAGAGGAAGANASTSGGAAIARGGTGSGGASSGGALAMGGAAPTTCPATVDCALSVCDGKACGANGRKCISRACSCPGGATRETSCSDGVDNDCDGAVDCADSDCPERTQCGSAANTRCCGGACVNTESDPNNCQACGSKCASGKSCVLLSDSYGRRGHCQCAGTNSLCPGHKSSSPTIICRTDTPNANLCAQEAASVCPAGQTFVDVSGGPNFCHY
jgi:hypothetical protein